MNVLIKHTTLGTLSSIGGQYSLALPDSISDPVLIFSFVGYEEQEVQVGNNTILDIELSSATQQLEEVVVVGYGVIDRDKLAGSVSSIGGEDIESDPVVGLNQAVQGKVAGVQVTQNSGTPGGALNFRVRGITTLNSSTTEPLYVVDGVPVNSDNYGGINAGARQTINPLASINQADVASIEVLKDASATAIYGARAANGVVLITTKKGKSGDSQVNLNAYYGLQELPNTINMANTQEYKQYVADLAALNDWEDPGFAAGDVYTNWQEELYQNKLIEDGEIAPIQSYTLSTSGGSEHTTYYVSGSYFNQEGIVRNSGYERLGLRTNLEHEINDWVKFGTNLSLSRGTTDRIIEDFGGAGPVTLALISRPNIPVYDENGDFYLDTLINRDNPIAAAEVPTYYDQVDRVLGNLYLEVEPLEGLLFRSTFGIDRTDNEGEFYRPREGIIAGMQRQGVRNTNRYLTFTWLNENTLTYHKTIGDHEFTALVGNTLQRASINQLSTAANGFATDEVVIVNNATSYNVSEREESWSLASFISRINYIFKDRYILTANYRIDGSSRFGQENLYGAFPSVAAAWRISEENFIQNIPTIDNLKLRASWGKSGNQPRDFYNAVPLYSISVYYGDYVGFIPQTIGNDQLGWESTTQYNIGLDLGLFENRISLLADYFIKKTEDLLTSYRMPQATGTLFTTVNLGNMENKGFEFELSSRNTEGAFSWNTSLNMSFIKNKVTYLAGEEVLDGLDDAYSLQSA
ncbi:TonB-linked SusC/RagA family outer membrane protein [Catalinimonas alkaloidigena]|nr:TonB-linked SusC/RagA family outer membrane protein [Catalinimonas alkaloidigena]